MTVLYSSCVCMVEAESTKSQQSSAGHAINNNNRRVVQQDRLDERPNDGRACLKEVRNICPMKTEESSDHNGNRRTT